MLRRRTIYFGSALHGAWMVALALLLLTKGCASGDEVLLVRLASIFRHASASMDEGKRFGEKFTFVDVAHDLQLVEKTDADGFPLGNQAITDRKKLARLFRIMKREDTHRFVLCDVFFEDSTAGTASLQRAASGLRDALFPYHLGPSGRTQRPVIDVPQGLAQYTLHGGAFVKFTLVQQDSLETIPLKMHRALYPERRVTGWMRLNTFIPDMEMPAEGIGQAIPLNQLLQLPEPILARDFLKDRIVVIGDFSSPADRHETVLGPMPGPLILANTYLALRAGNHRVSLGLLLFLWVAFSLLTVWNVTRLPALSHAAFALPGPWRGRRQKSRLERLLPLLGGGREASIWWNGLRNLLLLAVTSCIAYFTFSVHLHVLLLAAYLGVVNALLNDHFAPARSWWQKATAREPADRRAATGPGSSPRKALPIHGPSER